MEDVRDVGAELHRLAEAEAQDPFDPLELLQQGRRRKRRRKILTAGGAVAGVAAVALAATLLPNLGSAGNQPQVAGGESQEALFEPVPGVPRGEESADQPLTKAEAIRRCALRYPEGGQLRLDSGTKSGKMLSYQGKRGDKVEVQICNVPGGDKPSAALIAAAAKDPLPDTPAGVLRNCSVQAWVDLTGWRVMAFDRYESKRFASAVVVAVSPSGKKAVACNLVPPPPQEPAPRGNVANNRFFTLDAIDKDDPYLLPVKGSARADLFSAGGSKSTYTGWGRVASNATEVRLQLGTRPGYKVPVNDGWFAVAWAKPTETGGDFGALKAYDKNGKLVRVISEP
ncbi:hypothetical protein [Kribbella sp. NPDC023855]|uniref:hypothetical protein n=1 Tax=Kribbella sp. NPDC023855 TaxID=3154698 RepID=UPI003406330B